MTPDLISRLGKEPIAGATPAGADVRDEAAFEQLEAEVAKLANPVTSPTLDWHKVADLSAGLLSTTGKDLLVACYLAGGLLETGGLAGLADGLKVISDMLDTYWDSLHPSLKRMRGRRNAVQWLIDRVQQRASELNWAQLPAQNPALVDSLAASLGAIDATLAAKDSEAPSLRSLLTIVKTLPVALPPSAEPAPPSASLPSGGPSASASAGSPAPGLAQAADFQSPEHAERALEDSCTQLKAIAEWLMAQDSQNPAAYRLNRIAAWSPLASLPPAEGGKTRLPAPLSQVTDVLARLKSAQSDADLIEFAETQLPVFPFWLDLNFICAEALARRGSDYQPARREVCGETARLLSRLPGIEGLAFSDGTPFADGDTQAWLAGLAGLGGGTDAAPVPRSSGASVSEAVKLAIGNARALAAADDLVGATACLQQQLAQPGSARDQLSLQIRLCELLLEHRPGASLAPFAQTLLDALARHDLGAWDPALALDALLVAYRVISRNDDDPALAQSVLGKIVAIDAGAAVKLALG